MNLEQLKVGDVVWFDCCFVGVFPYKHYGLCFWKNEEWWVVHLSKQHKKVMQEPLASFAQGNELFISKQITSISPSKAVQRALSRIDSYDLFANNCEHFVRWAHDMKKESKQLQKRAVVTTGLVMTRVPSPPVQVAGVVGAAVGYFSDEKGALKNSLVAGGVVLGAVALGAFFSALTSKSSAS